MNVMIVRPWGIELNLTILAKIIAENGWCFPSFTFLNNFDIYHILSVGVLLIFVSINEIFLRHYYSPHDLRQKFERIASKLFSLKKLRKHRKYRETVRNEKNMIKLLDFIEDNDLTVHNTVHSDVSCDTPSFRVYFDWTIKLDLFFFLYLAKAID